MEKSPIEQIKDEKDWTIQDLAILADVSSSTAYKAIKAEHRKINRKVLAALAEAGYDPEELKEKYQSFREQKRKELIS
ncbi:MAG: LacI family DNA-binding transcriptional regulator [Clostridiales bacterium]|nr:LacI family DNA-binding transcriptional regulator [Clostridiales bacterium]